ncbi:MAG: sensor diguanylate cyclase [Ilumatobacteraceae bacterium]|nr:sensor diguanylate cyclase [Ilumatobacteraceae bacterium]
MIEPVIPDNERARLAALWQLELLDTPREESFDPITRLTQRVIGTPMALVSLVDADRQWFKSKHGIDAVETERCVSFCGHAINSSDILEVPDATKDPRFWDNPFVTGGLRVRFYAGCPIAAPDGSLIGTLCVIGDEPRHLSDADRVALRDLAAIVEQDLLLRRRAHDDELTGLSNRRGLHLVAGRAFALCRRQRVPAMLLYADVDGLKTVNDTAGHEAGDELIRAVADVFRGSFREADVVARIGGDEFAVLLSDCDASPAEMVARLERGLADPAASPSGLRLSVSIGTARFDPRAPSTLDELMRRADGEMYRAKQAKRLAATRSHPPIACLAG